MARSQIVFVNAHHSLCRPTSHQSPNVLRPRAAIPQHGQPVPLSCVWCVSWLKIFRMRPILTTANQGRQRQNDATKRASQEIECLTTKHTKHTKEFQKGENAMARSPIVFVNAHHSLRRPTSHQSPMSIAREPQFRSTVGRSPFRVFGVFRG